MSALAEKVPEGIDPQMTPDLSSGVRTPTLAVALDRREEGLRVAHDDGPGSPTRARMVVGK